MKVRSFAPKRDPPNSSPVSQTHASCKYKRRLEEGLTSLSLMWTGGRQAGRQAGNTSRIVNWRGGNVGQLPHFYASLAADDGA